MNYKAIIECETEEDATRMFEFIKRFCIDNFQNFKTYIEGTELNYESKR